MSEESLDFAHAVDGFFVGCTRVHLEESFFKNASCKVWYYGMQVWTGEADVCCNIYTTVLIEHASF